VHPITLTIVHSCTSSQFNQAVRVRSLVLQAQERGPEKLRLRINCSAIDFTNFEDSGDTQIISLKADQVSKDGSVKPIPLHPTKFNHVNSLHVSLGFSFRSPSSYNVLNRSSSNLKTIIPESIQSIYWVPLFSKSFYARL
jgi:hypothetical protein